MHTVLETVLSHFFLLLENVQKLKYTVKPLYTDIRYNDKIRYNDNLNGTIPRLKMRQIIRDI